MAGRDGVSQMQSFIDRHDLGHLVHLVDDDGSLWARFGVTSQPSWAFIDDSGTAETRFGIVGEDGIRSAMDQLAAS